MVFCNYHAVIQLIPKCTTSPLIPSYFFSALDEPYCNSFTKSTDHSPISLQFIYKGTKCTHNGQRVQLSWRKAEQTSAELCHVLQLKGQMLLNTQEWKHLYITIFIQNKQIFHTSQNEILQIIIISIRRYSFMEKSKLLMIM